MSPDDKSAEAIEVNPGYAHFQIAKALTTAATHSDDATRKRAQEKVSKWAVILGKMLTGQLSIGSRQPISDLPAWVTLEVVTGGFATGRALADGPLQAHEEAQLQHLGIPTDPAPRHTLNAFFLSDPGLADLTARLQSGLYEITVPEEGAFLVAAWLATHGHADAARALIEILQPHFSSLRFYPAPVSRPAQVGDFVHLEDVGTTRGRLQRIRPNLRILAQREAIEVWTPLYESMIALFAETVSGDLPTIAPDEEGRWILPGTNKFAIRGGWPCQQYPVDWTERARQVCDEYTRARSAHTFCGKPAREEDGLARLHGYLQSCVRDPRALTGRDVGMIRLILARHITRCGAPHSSPQQERRARQRRQVAAPNLHDIAAIVLARLATYPSDTGLETLDAALQPVTGEETRHSPVPIGTAIPSSLLRKVSRCLCGTPGLLVERGIITSGETLAQVIPQRTSGLLAASFDDPDLCRLSAAIYRAFRRRRSLLLLNLEKQVQVEELPWVAVLKPLRRVDFSHHEILRHAFRELAALTLRSFPETIIPNKLLREFRALAKGADCPLPLVEELAADIFMDDFSPKFTAAAKQAAQLLEGSLYARYFGIDYTRIRGLSEPPAQPQRRPFSGTNSSPANPFAALCIERAGVAGQSQWSVARNGMVIEQAQIVTTQNLAVLFAGLDLAEELRGDLRGMAERCVLWIDQRRRARTRHHHATLIMLKKIAYAWRQAIFYLSFLPGEEVSSFLSWAEKYLTMQSNGFDLSPLLHGLSQAHAGHAVESTPTSGARTVRPFLGWCQERHWILGS